jgi:Inosine-uridine preferring nucleoside hydrolase
MTPKDKTVATESIADTNLSRRDFLASSSALAVSAALGNKSRLSRVPHVPASAATQQNAPASPSKPLRLIIDTDPGVDDAVGILLALRSPELQVEAITAVSGNVPLELTLPNALRLVEIAGRTNIPVAGGASHPLTRRLVTARYAHGNNGLAGVDFRRHRSNLRANPRTNCFAASSERIPAKLLSPPSARSLISPSCCAATPKSHR